MYYYDHFDKLTKKEKKRFFSEVLKIVGICQKENSNLLKGYDINGDNIASVLREFVNSVNKENIQL